MKALVLKEYKVLEYANFDDPQMGHNEVLVQIKACGICGSDIHGYDGSTGRRIPPIIMGHEASGEIVAVGSSVKEWKVGARVTFDSTVYCNQCVYCLNGQVNLCNNRQVLGVSCDEYRRHGAMADLVAIPQHILYALPDSVSYEQACMVEPLAIAFHAANLTPITINDTAVVVGVGMIGLLVIQTLRLAGCGNIVAVDIDENKLEMAKTIGADYCISANSKALVEKVKEISWGDGAEIAIDAVGVSSSLNTAISVLKKGGHLTLIGNLSARVDLPLQTVVTRQLRLQGSCASNGEYKACLDMIARNSVNVDFLISHVAPLETGEKWFAELYGGNSSLLKVILTP